MLSVFPVHTAFSSTPIMVLGGRMPAHLELGYLLLVAALAQAILAAVVLILLPLLPRVRDIRSAPGKGAALGYFLLIGIGFMLLEMGFMQRLIVYTAHPIYSAATVIGGFLVFAGLGSQLSGIWRIPRGRLGALAGATVAALTAGYMLFLGPWLGLTQGQPVAVRCAVAVVTIAPLALAMGHMFPVGMRLIGEAAPALVPWAWAVNGCASVAATIAASVLAMGIGFTRLILVALLCYAGAAALSLRLHKTQGAEVEPKE